MGLILTQKRSLTERHEKAIRHTLEAIKQSELSSYVEDVILYGSCARYEQRWECRSRFKGFNEDGTKKSEP
ncbi:hypothetical protein B6K86_09100 [Lachnospiraceae bacterium]|nr:hypothetical protein B6K86_09100 [Lachnospiraceae bacterium]